MNFKKENGMTREKEEDFKDSSICWFCEFPLDGEVSEISVN